MKNQHYEREDIKATDIANNQIPYKHKNSFIFLLRMITIKVYAIKKWIEIPIS